MQLFVIRGKARTFVFDNHDAALRCRRALKLDQEHLIGCVVFSDWWRGEPHREETAVSSVREDE